MTLMIRRVTTVLTTPLFVSAPQEPFARVTRWTEARRLPPPMPSGWEIELDSIDLLDDA